MRHFSDTFGLADEGQGLVAQLVQDLDEFAHLRECRIAVLASQETPMLHGHPCWAFIARPQVQGACKPLFDFLVSRFTAGLFEGEDPDYLLILDAAVWAGWARDPLGQVRKEA